MLKIWLVLTILFAVASAIVGAISITRSGCHLYTHLDVEEASTWCVEGAGVLSAAASGLLMVYYVSEGGLAHLPDKYTGTVMLLGVAIVIIAGLIAAGLAKLSFRVGKRIKFLWLKHQTLKQRALCRKIQQEMTECCKQKELSTDDLLLKYVCCCKEVMKMCPQPVPTRCPIGMRRPFGLINDRHVAKLAEHYSSALSALNATTRGCRVINLVEPDCFDPDASFSAPLPSIMASIEFISYVEDDKKVLLSASDAQGLSDFMSNFIPDDDNDEAEPA